MSNCTKCKSSKKDGLIGCEGICNKWFHYSCVNFTENEFKLLEKNKNLFYLCDTCKCSCQVLEKSVFNNVKKNITGLADDIATLCANFEKFSVIQSQNLNSEIEKIKVDLRTHFENEFQELKKSLIEGNSISTSGNKNYAAAMKNSSTVILQPKDVKQNISVTKSDVLHAVDPVKSGVAVSNTKMGRNGSLIIKCPNKDDVDKISVIAADKLSEKYVVKELPQLKPRVKVVGISGDELIKDDMLPNYIVNQNKDLFSDTAACEVITWSALKNKKGNNTSNKPANTVRYQAIIQVDITAYNNILKNGYLIIGLDYCMVYDAVEIRRCFNCCGYHHFSKQCSQRMPTCPRCAERHVVKDCNSENLKCVNCVVLNGRQKDKVDVEHAAWDLANCSAYQRATSDFKRNILSIQ